jgi:hypothetical protein
MNQCWNRDPSGRPSIQEVKRRVIALRRASIDMVSNGQQVPNSDSFPSSCDSVPRPTGSPAFLPASKKLPGQAHTVNTITRTPLTRTSLPSPSLDPFSFPSTAHRTPVQVRPNTMKVQPSFPDVHDYPGNTEAGLDTCVVPNGGPTSTDKKHMRSFESAVQTSLPAGNLRIRSSLEVVTGERKPNPPPSKCLNRRGRI